MSILIKNMEMPTTCRDCRLSTFTNFDSMPFCNITMDDICFNDWETKRCDNCPLVPVPQHGKLIDADAFIEKCEEMADKEDGNQLDALVLLRWFLEQNAPTIIPAEPPKEE